MRRALALAFVAIVGTGLVFGVSAPSAAIFPPSISTAFAPTGLAVAKPANPTGSCAGVGLTANGSTIKLASATLAARTTRTLTVNITASAGGTFTVNSGPVSSLQGGEGATASAALHVVASNAFTVTHISGLRISLEVAGSGKVGARETSGGGVAAETAHAKRAGTVHLRLKLTAKGRAELHRGSLKVTLRVTFTPTGGKPRTKTVPRVKLAG